MVEGNGTRKSEFDFTYVEFKFSREPKKDAYGYVYAYGSFPETDSSKKFAWRVFIRNSLGTTHEKE